MIKPTVGRILWYYQSPREFLSIPEDRDKPLASIVTYVHSDTLVNLTVFGSNGHSHPKTSVILAQDDNLPPVGTAYATWMPYQISQAAKESQNTPT